MANLLLNLKSLSYLKNLWSKMSYIDVKSEMQPYWNEFITNYTILINYQKFTNSSSSSIVSSSFKKSIKVWFKFVYILDTNSVECCHSKRATSKRKQTLVVKSAMKCSNFLRILTIWSKYPSTRYVKKEYYIQTKLPKI